MLPARQSPHMHGHRCPWRRELRAFIQILSGCVGEGRPGTERARWSCAQLTLWCVRIWARHRDPPWRDQPLPARQQDPVSAPASIEDSTGQHRLGLLCPKIGFFHRHIEGNQHRAGFDNLPRRELHLADRPANSLWRVMGGGQHGPDRGRSLVMVTARATARA